jgi:hypothetical protein
MSRRLKAWPLGPSIASRGPTCEHCLWPSLVVAHKIAQPSFRAFASLPVLSPKQSSLRFTPNFLGLENIKKTVRQYLRSDKDYAAILRSGHATNRTFLCTPSVSV